MFTPQIVGATVVDPPTMKVSVQVPAVAPNVEGPPMVKETKSNLKIQTDKANHFLFSFMRFYERFLLIFSHNSVMIKIEILNNI